MKATPIFSVLLAALISIGCNSEVATTGPDKTPDTDEVAKPLSNVRLTNYTLGEPVQVDNMTIIPLKPNEIPTQKEPLVDYLTLDEATQKGVIEIKELDHPEVNLLKVHNKGSQPILLVGGDLLLGGQQDRVVQEDSIVQPGITAAVKVFCVEHGRWTGSDKFGAGGKVPWSVRGAAVFDNDQSMVWSEVETFNRARKADSSVTSVRAGIEASDAEVDPKVQRLLAGLQKQQDAVGAVFAINGEVKAMDAYANAKLFRSSCSGLLRGFVVEALSTANKVETAPKEKEVAGFVEKYEKLRSSAIASQSNRNLASLNRDGVRLQEMRGSSGAARSAHVFMDQK